MVNSRDFIRRDTGYRGSDPSQNSGANQKKAFVIMRAKSVKDKIWQYSSQHSSYQCESREKNGLWNDSEATAIFRRETDRIVFRSVESKVRVVLCSS